MSTLTQGSSQAEVLNVVGPLKTIADMNNDDTVQLNGAVKTKGLKG